MIGRNLNNGHENSIRSLTRQRRANTNDNLKVVLRLGRTRCWLQKIEGIGRCHLRLSIGLLWSLLLWETITWLRVRMNRSIQLLVLQLLLLIGEVWVRCGRLPSFLQHLVYELLLRILVTIHRHLFLFMVVLSASTWLVKSKYLPLLVRGVLIVSLLVSKHLLQLRNRHGLLLIFELVTHFYKFITDLTQMMHKWESTEKLLPEWES